MAKKKLTIDDIFNDDDFGLLDSKAKTSTIKTDEDRLIDSFEEINVFFDKIIESQILAVCLNMDF